MRSVCSWMRSSPPYLSIIIIIMFHFFKKKPTLHIPFLNGEKTETSEVASLRTKERIFMVWAIAAIILLITTACIWGFFYLKNYFFKLGIKTGEKASYGRLYTSITEAGCRPIDISAPEGSIKWDKISLLNMACFMQPQRSSSWTMMRNAR